MGLFKTKSQDDWKVNYIKEFNEMRDAYEEKLRAKQMEIESLKEEIEHLRLLRNNLKPKEKQIKDSDIEQIKELRNDGLSYREISKETSWSKATVCRVLNGLYD
ncbi:MAG: Trp family transcriptional regulator [Terrisporobacter othiniensis]|uniref:DNA-binding protein n=1 Tax=Terrisporobacter hibernicus TaxID=2813371 RepID=A0AAX2ZB03_9FIRM|nr:MULTISPECIES: Trp family transcriptional regulator [Terrisporobacter]MDU4861426.1 Trp family transcriptional regulator [Terrisporobacter othiniensis]MDU6994625.1 Trp family transcriptional regulator [Terrisporobacter othiniensis]UEL46277.1 DNA-binding protein [Terrisporobacter hibernicus]SFJ59830.1 Trp repressor protein [Terrisporobacter glycolicus]